MRPRPNSSSLLPAPTATTALNLSLAALPGVPRIRSRQHQHQLADSGFATGIGAGTHTITATSGNITPDTATLTVTSASATSLAISGPASSHWMSVSNSRSTATFSDGTTQDVTNVCAPGARVHLRRDGHSQRPGHWKNLGTTNISAAFESVNDQRPAYCGCQQPQFDRDSGWHGKHCSGYKITVVAIGHFNNGSTNNLSTIVTWSVLRRIHS